MKILSFIAWSIVVALIIDLVGFLAWALSGQYPADGAYLGTITAHVLGLFL